jgi:hypothetical protein
MRVMLRFMLGFREGDQLLKLGNNVNICALCMSSFAYYHNVASYGCILGKLGKPLRLGKNVNICCALCMSSFAYVGVQGCS